MPEVSREPVRRINHRGGSPFFCQPLAQIQSRLRIKMFLQQLPFPLLSSRPASQQQLQSQLSFAQRATNANQISRARPGTQHRMTAPDFSDTGQIYRSQSTSRSIAASQRQPETTSRPSHSFQDTVIPFASAARWQGQVQQKIQRPRAHGSQVTRCPCKSFVADGLRRMYPQQKVNVFEERVSREYPFDALFRA